MLNEVLLSLLEITEGCRPDMHEPDEQDISAHVVGDHLDNAFGSMISSASIAEKCQEFIVIIDRDGTKRQFNLADLIALARMADKYQLHKAIDEVNPNNIDRNRALEKLDELMKLWGDADLKMEDVNSFIAVNHRTIKEALEQDDDRDKAEKLSLRIAELENEKKMLIDAVEKVIRKGIRGKIRDDVVEFTVSNDAISHANSVLLNIKGYK